MTTLLAMWCLFALAIVAQLGDLVITAIGSARGYTEGNPMQPVSGLRKWFGNAWPVASKLPVYIALGVALYINQPLGIWIVSALALVAGAWASVHNLRFMKVI